VKLEQLIRVAKGEEMADLLLRHVKLVNVFSGEIYETDVALMEDRIAAIGEGYLAREVMDLKGLYLAPGFIDGHVHIESSMVEIPQFARAVVPLGTTSVVADPHEIANIFGFDGIRYMLDAAKYNPLNVFFMLPSCVPATDKETSGSYLRAFDIYPFLKEKWVLGLGEVMNYMGVLEREDDVLDKIKITEDKPIDGHAPGLRGKALNAYIAAGIASDHECTTVEEAREKLRRGMYLMIREGTSVKNLQDLLPLITPENSRRCFFVTDDRHPNDILREGHINFMVRTAIQWGINPVTAIRMATLNAAEYFGLRRLGAIKPGNIADLVVFDNFKDLNILRVFKNGKLVAIDGEPIYEPPLRPRFQLRGSVNIKWLEGDEFVIPARGRRCRVIGIIEGQAVTESMVEEAPIQEGQVVSDPKRDILKCFVVERHKASGNIGKGLVKGLGLKRGAVALSIAHDSHNIIAAGVSDQDIFKAVVQINKMGGGIAVVEEGAVVEAMELPIGGLMSPRPLKEVAQRINSLTQKIRNLGSSLKDPLMVLSFMALPVIPKLKLTDGGLVDVEKFQFVDLFVDAENERKAF